MNSIARGSLVVFLSAVSVQAASFSSLIDFGDSLSDAGNTYSVSASFHGQIPVIPGAPGYSNGRFSNGPVWVQDLGTKLGVGAVTASTAGGNDFAYGGTTTDASSTDFFLPNLRNQIFQWTNANHATTAQLFTVLSGANDIFNELDSTHTATQQTSAIVTAAGNVAMGVQMLYDAGARNVIVANLPNLGLTPSYRGSAQQAQATSLTTTFDTTLAADLAALAPTTTGLNLQSLDLQTLFAAAIADPSAFGLSNVTDRAYTGDDSYAGNGTAVADPSGYLFWDAVHPTATGHALIANAAYALVVPEPASLSLLAASSVILLRRARRHVSSAPSIS